MQELGGVFRLFLNWLFRVVHWPDINCKQVFDCITSKSYHVSRRRRILVGPVTRSFADSTYASL